MKPQVITLRGKISIMDLCTGFGSEVTEYDPLKWNDISFLVYLTSTFWLI